MAWKMTPWSATTEVNTDATLLDPDTLPSPDASDGLPPAESPTPEVAGSVTTIHLSWPPVDNDDPVTYLVYAASTTPVVAIEANLVATTTSNYISLSALADGIPFTQETVYYFAVVATDADGQAALGGEASGQLHPIDADDFAATYIYAGKIYADQIAGGTIQADLALANRITTGPPGTPRVDIGPDGVILYALAGGEEFVEVLLPTDPEQSATFSGDVLASTLTVTDGATFRGTSNAVARSSAFVLDDRLTAPTSPPAVTVGWASVVMDDGQPHPDPSGIERHWDPAAVLGGISVATTGPYAGKVLATQPVPATGTTPAGEVLWGYEPTTESLEVLAAPVPPQASFAATFNIGDETLGGTGTPMTATLYLGGITPGTIIDWGDGQTSEFPDGTTNVANARAHTYESPGIYQMQIWGGFTLIGRLSQKDVEMAPLISVDLWEATGTISAASAFRNARNLTSVAAPPSSVTSMFSMFNGASSFNADLSAWDTSGVTTMNSMFFNASSFNADLSAWDTSSVTDMTSMFNGASSFNADLSAWDTSGVTTMTSMFNGASSFNADLSAWDTSSVTDMTSMFRNSTIFSQDLSGWDTSSVKSMFSMFFNATIFSQDLSGWNVAKVTNHTNFATGSAMTPEQMPHWPDEAA